MIDELTIYNLEIKYPNTVDLVREVEKMTIDEFKDRLLELCDCGLDVAKCFDGECTKCYCNSVDYSSIIDLAEELKAEAGGKEEKE